MKCTTLLFAAAFACVSSVLLAVDYYPIPSVTASTEETDLWPVSNLIQGPGVGFAEDDPNDKISGGSEGNWVTADDAGFPADYIEEVGQPVIHLDLGQDRTLDEISVWGYASGNANGTSRFSLRFATDAEGSEGYGQSVTYNPTFDLPNDDTRQQYRLFEEKVVARYVEFTNVDNFFISPGQGAEPDVEPEPRLLPFRPGGDRVGLGEIAFMDLPDSFQPGDKIPRPVGGDVIGTLELQGELGNQQIGPVQPGPGLAQYWFDGNLMNDPEAIAALGTEGSADNPLVNLDGKPIASSTTWWSGSADLTVNGEALGSYPAELVGTRFDGSANENSYTVKLVGEIFIPEDGEFIFRDGVDDYTMLAIDQDGNGELDDLDSIVNDDVDAGAFGDVLINDSDWAGANGGGQPFNGFAEFENIASGGEWRKIEMWMSEGGGGDAGTLYMASVNDDDLWDDTLEDALTQEQVDKFLIPNDQLRGEAATLLSADLVATLANKDTHEYVIQVGADGNDQIALPAEDGVTRILDLSDSTVRIAASGDIAEGTEFMIFGADQVNGLDTLTLLFDDASQWDLSQLAEGKIIFGAGSACNPNTMGDINGDGAVGFPDFLLLSANFGNEVASHAEGDINCDGSVGFPDFLLLSANFGNTVGGAASVPEPAGWALGGFVGLALATTRRRRRN